MTDGVDDGFSLIESVVAMSIATIALLALGFSFIGVVQAAAFSRENQQAGDVLNQALEQARALPYDSLSMQTTDLDVDDTRTPSLSSGKVYDPTSDITSGGSTEPLVLDPAGQIAPHATAVAGTGAATYMVRRYVTLPTDATGSVYKRLTVVVTWTTRGQTKVRRSSTLIAPTKRGLPLPDFKYTLSSAASQCRNPGSSLVYAFTLKNNGARDAWQLAGSAPWTWTWYQDVDGNLGYSSTVDTALPVDPTSGLPNTGLLEPTQSRRLLAVTAVPSGTTTPTTVPTTFTAMSLAVSTYSQALVTNATVQSGACAGSTPPPAPITSSVPPTQPGTPCATLNPSATATTQGSGTLVRYYLHNGSATTNTSTAATMPLNKVAPSSNTMWDFSNEVSAAAGRVLQAPATNTTPAYVADWRYQMPADTKLKGNALLMMYATGAGFTSLSSQTFVVTLDDVGTSGAVTPISSSTINAGPFSCAGGFTGLKVSLPLDSNGQTVSANDLLRVRIKATGTGNTQLGYDSTGYTAFVDLPIFSGVG